ncbi:MAG: hypothetical protein ACKOX7_06385 [Bacteroidota bacterium]
MKPYNTTAVEDSDSNNEKHQINTMDILNKTIKKLSDAEYQDLLMQVSGKKKNKPFMVLETTRNRDVEDSEMMDLLQVNASAYYTLKSRLNSKIAAILSKNVRNPISILMDEVTRVPAHLFGTNKEFSVRALKELEKQLIEYDLSSELIVVYKTLAQLHMYDEEFDQYDKLYKKHVAFSLAVSKAEGLYYRYIVKFGNQVLSPDKTTLNEMENIRKEMFNICDLYDSHRLFVLYNIVSMYHMLLTENDQDSLRSKELDVEKTLNEMSRIFNRYHLDTFYQHVKPLTNLLYFEYYQKAGNQIRANHYHERSLEHMEDLCQMHTMSFHVARFMEAKLDKYMADGNIDSLTRFCERFANGLDIDTHETYQFVTWKKFLAACKFYQRDNMAAAKTINDLRNRMSLKNHFRKDVECKLFQALQYCMVGEDGLCTQIISSLKRQIRDNDSDYENAQLFMKILKTALKPADFRKKVKRIGELWAEFKETGKTGLPMLQFLQLDEAALRKMANPIKE